MSLVSQLTNDQLVSSFHHLIEELKVLTEEAAQRLENDPTASLHLGVQRVHRSGRRMLSALEGGKPERR